MQVNAADEAPPETFDEDDLLEGPERSLAEDLKELWVDGRTLLHAEFAYNKARGLFAADAFKSIALFGAMAALLCVLALMGLTVGLIIALTPYLTALGATAVVVLALLLVAFLLVRSAAGRWRRMVGMLSDESPNL